MMIARLTVQNLIRMIDKAGIYQGGHCSMLHLYLGTQGRVRGISFFVFAVFSDQGGCCPTLHLSQGARGSLSHVCSSQYLLISETDFTFQKNSKTNYIFQKKRAKERACFCSIFRLPIKIPYLLQYRIFGRMKFYYKG